MSVKTVKVSNVSRNASEQELKEFFSFYGDIEYLEIKSEGEEDLAAYVTFKDSQGAKAAVLLTGVTIVDMTVTISLDPDYELPPAALAQSSEEQNPESVPRKAEDVVTNMLSKGFIVGQDAVGKAKSFDEKIGFTEKINMGTSAVNSKVKEMDEKFKVSEKTKTAFSAAGETVSNAGSAIIKNRYVLTGATWVTGAFGKVTKVTGEVSQMTKERFGLVDDNEQKRKIVDDFAQAHLSEPDSPISSSPMVFSSPKGSVRHGKQPMESDTVQGLVL